MSAKSGFAVAISRGLPTSTTDAFPELFVSPDTRPAVLCKELVLFSTSESVSLQLLLMSTHVPSNFSRRGEEAAVVDF
jgi:hypothetical protein